MLSPDEKQASYLAGCELNLLVFIPAIAVRQPSLGHVPGLAPNTEVDESAAPSCVINRSKDWWPARQPVRSTRN